MTFFHVEGYDYNDYLAEYLNEDNDLANFYKFNEIDETTNSLINKIYNNIGNIDKKIKIKQAIKEADIITISLGMDELNNYAKKNNLSTTKIKNFLTKYEEIIKIISKLNNKQIYILSLYSTNLINQVKTNKINEELKKLAEKYQLIYIDVSDITTYNEFFIQKNNYYLNYKGQKFIFKKIQKTI